MTQEVHASIWLMLPDDPKEQATALAKATNEWAKLVHALDGGIATFVVGKSVEPVRRRRGRPRKQPNGDAMAAADEFQRQAGVS